MNPTPLSLKPILNQLLDKARADPDIPKMTTLGHGLKILIRTTDEFHFLFAIGRPEVYPSLTEWRTCLTCLPTPDRPNPKKELKRTNWLKAKLSYQPALPLLRKIT